MDNNTEAAVGIDEALSAIRTELAGLHAQSKFLNEVVDRLHAENEQLRRAGSKATVQPALRELIKLADDWRSRAAAIREGADSARLCADVVEDVTLVLERQGVEAFSADAGAEFDRHEHRAVGTQVTEDETLDGRVAEARRPGYRSDERVVRFAEVVVYKVATGG
ncbi:nucleotide exchange factor GrpE [Amycolatopsis sp. WQ 127309]|uniref:nucleotide exchange factor GrpE n=1 Tax=Amycolatopsis sp. WQ 127309 TaxID=2932773 RepID=UPI001FF52804|nr:nucleotide exchange factor GrpE [Amycolatopsis sp. WQ 127309]UOZ07943.1 nucleotide exchange factor GrpE [Amycolatopsis sp. WQ 127309]